jgi:putative drug exporter of the RND superfamily
MPSMIETMKDMKTMMLTMYATQKGMQDQQSAMQENSTAKGEAFDASMNDDSFYLPPEVFNNEEFKRGMKNFIRRTESRCG